MLERITRRVAAGRPLCEPSKGRLLTRLIFFGRLSVPALAVVSRGVVAPRDARWLRGEMEEIWRRHFGDIERANQVDIDFRRAWKRRLGVIALSPDRATTRIGINSLLGHDDAPYVLTLITVAHELAHYCHGFGSPLPRKYRHPHRGGIVTRELKKRGLGAELAEYSAWVKKNWWSFYAGRVRRRR